MSSSIADSVYHGGFVRQAAPERAPAWWSPGAPPGRLPGTRGHNPRNGCKLRSCRIVEPARLQSSVLTRTSSSILLSRS